MTAHVLTDPCQQRRAYVMTAILLVMLGILAWGVILVSHRARNEESYKRQLQTREEKAVKAKAAAEDNLAVAQQVAEVMTTRNIELSTEKDMLAKHAAELEDRRMIMQSLIEFLVEHENVVILRADKSGKIFHIHGNPSVLGWTREGLMGQQAEIMRPVHLQERHARSYQQRRAEGNSGELFHFKNKSMLTGEGKTIWADGCVLWHPERQYFVALISPNKTE